MSRDKQTEIANDLNMHCVSLSEQFCGEMSCNACISNWLYNAGYRKSTEIAEEIFEEIWENADLLYDGYRDIVVITEKDFAELKKKYTEGGGWK